MQPVVVWLVVLLAGSAAAFNMTRRPLTLKRQQQAMTMMEAVAANLTWVTRVPCNMTWAQVTAAEAALDASNALYETSSGALGLPCTLGYVAQASRSTIFVVTCADDVNRSASLSSLITAPQAGNLSGACAHTLVFTRDRIVRNTSTTETVSNAGLWNLDRIDQRNLPLDHKYTYNLDGTGVNIYSIDTGCLVTHEEFTGRATFLYNFADSTNSDCNGHGMLICPYTNTNHSQIAQMTNDFRNAHPWHRRRRYVWRRQGCHTLVYQGPRLQRKRHALFRHLGHVTGRRPSGRHATTRGRDDESCRRRGHEYEQCR